MRTLVLEYETPANALAAIGWAGQPPPDIGARLRLPLSSCGYWRKSNGLRARQRPGGRREVSTLSWASAAGVRLPGAVRGKGPGTRPHRRRSQAWHPSGSRLPECSNLCLWAVPPTGFEPALTAPEANAVW